MPNHKDVHGLIRPELRHPWPNHDDIHGLVRSDRRASTLEPYDVHGLIRMALQLIRIAAVSNCHFRRTPALHMCRKCCVPQYLHGFDELRSYLRGSACARERGVLAR